MDRDPADIPPIEEHDPIPGSPRSRVSLIIGLVLLVGLLAFFAWFMATHTETQESPGMFGAAEVAGVVRAG